MSRDNLGSRQKMIADNCLIKDERYNLVNTPFKQTFGYFTLKRQTQKKTIIAKQKQIIKPGF